MAMSVRYHSIDGEILYQSGADGRIDYLPDALGNVMATTKPNQPGVVDNTYRYKPYGDRLAKTGTGIDPKYQWVGTRTYRDTSLAHSSHYMIHRHYAEEEGRWATVDPIWPVETSYGYCYLSPVTLLDIDGKTPKLSIRTIVPCKQCQCPSIVLFWKVRFEMSFAKTDHKDGFIIQKVTADLKTERCTGGGGRPDRLEYYEAYEVSGGKTYCGFASGGLSPAHDPRRIDLNQKCRHGSMSQSFEARYVPNIKLNHWKRELFACGSIYIYIQL